MRVARSLLGKGANNGKCVGILEYPPFGIEINAFPEDLLAGFEDLYVGDGFFVVMSVSGWVCLFWDIMLLFLIDYSYALFLCCFCLWSYIALGLLL